jgi:hypothetical protein
MNGDTWAPGRGTPVRFAPRFGQGQDDTDMLAGDIAIVDCCRVPEPDGRVYVNVVPVFPRPEQPRFLVGGRKPIELLAPAGETVDSRNLDPIQASAPPPVAVEPPPPDRYWFVPAERPGTYAVWWTVYGPGQCVGTVKLAAGAVEWITMKEFCGIFERPARRAAEEAAATGELAPTASPPPRTSHTPG